MDIPARRDGIVVPVKYDSATFAVTYNFISGMVFECFCAPTQETKIGADMQGMLADGCIAISLILQHTHLCIGDLAVRFGENRPEGAIDGPPASILGAIARMGATLEQEYS